MIHRSLKVLWVPSIACALFLAVFNLGKTFGPDENGNPNRLVWFGWDAAAFRSLSYAKVPWFGVDLELALFACFIAIAAARIGLVVHERTVESPQSGKTCCRCGYDLRASPHRCPECGNVVQSADKAA